MKTYRTVAIILAVVVVWLAYLQLFGSRKAAVESPKEMWHTNTVELWHTNTVEKWYTNAVTVEVPVTNTVVQTVPKEVVKEVPAKLTSQERDAALVGYKFLNAPSVTERSNALYKVGPIALNVQIGGSVAEMLGKDAEAVKKSVETVLRAQKIPVASNSPYNLTVDINSSWNTAVPDVMLLVLKVELKENVVVQRQNELVKCTGAVWCTTTLRLARTFNFAEEVKMSIRGPLTKFCSDYLAAKEKEKDVASRLPSIPNGFLSGGG